MIPIKDNKGLFRDEKSNAVVNCNDAEYHQYLKIKNQKLQEKQEIEQIKSDISEIKDALKILIEKINK